ncbi:OpgC domain-containing protein [Lichenihabitans sp. Uapishka_5]|uniref:OpgC family protein n=1 Tax=Lichenihabitans sp. Uapishka_5 TaxID=3037302 RepID=UPI0029E7E1EF|nr:OpgC domain-containing protein [Lichenihabitans sp. Uapishka_5]MDX7951428.1 OpgC domain-containing protein [Lichenihabitans sp. Uapishka_5]
MKTHGAKPAIDASTQPLPARRRTDVDFWRGVVLCCIFINHIPGNAFERLTPKNYGFSDSAEAFVFLSGLSLAFAYVGRFSDGRAGQVMQSLQWRVAKLYGIHLFLSVAAIAIFAAAASFGGDDALMNQHGRALFTDDPAAALLGLASLGHQLGYFNILPLYIVLIAILVVQLVMVRMAGPWPMLAVSALFYAVVRVFDINIPTWPMKGSWFFNPLAWQLLMAVGIVAALLLRDGRLRSRPVPLALAGLVVAAGAVSVTDGFSLLPGLYDWTRNWADLDKTTLGLGRLVHFIALAYLLFGLGVAARLRRTWSYAPFCRLGRNSLTVFALLSLLAAVGQVAEDLIGTSFGLDLLLIVGGLAILYATAWASETLPQPGAERRARLDVRQR